MRGHPLRAALVAAWVGAASPAAAVTQAGPGSERWGTDLANQVAAAGLVVDLPGSPGRLVVGDLAGTVHALDVEKGDVAWRYDAGEGVYAAPALHAATQQVVIALLSGRVIGIDAREGHNVWEANLGERIVAAPVIAEDGAIVIATHKGYMYRLEPRTGQTIERRRLPGPALQWPVAIEGERILATVQNPVKALVLLEGTGSQTRTEFATERLPSASPAVTPNGDVVYAVGGTEAGTLEVRNLEGDLLFEHATRSGTPVGVSLTGTGSGAWIVGQDRHGGTWLQYSQLDTADGTWSVSKQLTAQAAPAGPAAVGIDGTAWVALVDGTVLAQPVPSTANEIGWHEVGSSPVPGQWVARPDPAHGSPGVTAPPVAGHGAVFVAARSGRVRAIEAGSAAGPRGTGPESAPEQGRSAGACRPSHYEWVGENQTPTMGLTLGEPGIAPLADAPTPATRSAWPTVGQNAQRTGHKPGAYCLPGEVLATLPRGREWKVRITPAGAGATEAMARLMEGGLGEEADQKLAVAVASGRYEIRVEHEASTAIREPPLARPVLRATFVVRNPPRQRLAIGEEVPVPRAARGQLDNNAGPVVSSFQRVWEATRAAKCKGERPTKVRSGLVWSAQQEKLYAAVPGDWRITWTTSACTPFSTRVRVVWPQDPKRIQTHVAGAPVRLLAAGRPEGASALGAFRWIPEGEDREWQPLTDGIFRRDTPGRSVLAWADAERPGGGSRLHLMAVESIAADQALLGKEEAIVGREIRYWEHFSQHLDSLPQQETDARPATTPPTCSRTSRRLTKVRAITIARIDAGRSSPSTRADQSPSLFTGKTRLGLRRGAGRNSPLGRDGVTRSGSSSPRVRGEALLRPLRSTRGPSRRRATTCAGPRTRTVSSSPIRMVSRLRAI